MTQLTDKVREAIIGNVGTVISGRIGITDAEILVKKFAPTFDAEDLTKMPNYQSVTSVMINNVPSAPFSMSFIAPLGQSNAQLSDALKRLSAAKYGKPRQQVEKDIFARLGAADAEKKAKAEALKKAQQERMTGMTSGSNSSGGGSSFLDEWLAKRKQIGGAKPPAPKPLTPAPTTTTFAPAAPQPVVAPMPTTQPISKPLGDNYPAAQTPVVQQAPQQPTQEPAPTAPEDKLHLRGDKTNSDSEISIKLR
jgi:hypothetical protein